MNTSTASIIVAILLTGFNSCKSPSIQTVFETGQKDSATELNAMKYYILKKQTTNSDFNYSKLNDIDDNVGKRDTVNAKTLMPVFEPVIGHFNYFQFLATFIGEAYSSDGPRLFKTFHDIIIIKTDNSNRIIDAFQYTIEWGERPLQYDVYKSSETNVILVDNLDIQKLIFMRTSGWDTTNMALNESGVIQLN